MIVEARRTAGSDPVALELMAAMVEEMGRLYEPELARAPVAPEELSPPAGGFVVLSEGGRALAGGGVKRLDARTGEIKRMYVVPAARGRGVGRELLSALEELARDLGYAVVRLDTGAEQPRAQRIYERAGYRPVPDYNGNPYASFWGEKALAPADRARGDSGS
jgi:GNAT superfamily N-acetyltransferase